MQISQVKAPLQHIAAVCALAMLLLTSATSSAMSEKPKPDAYTKTQNPIVLVHGLFGWSKLIGSIDYWYGIEKALRDGGATVYVVNVQGTSTITARGEELAEKLVMLKAKHGHSKVNLIGHSYGAPTSRYVAVEYPELVSSVSTVAGVNQGTDLANKFVEVAQKPIVAKIMWSVGNALGTVIDGLSGQETPTKQDIEASANTMSYEGMNAWNQTYGAAVPANCNTDGEHVVNNIHYYSWGGNVQLTNALDPLDWLTMATSTAFDNKDHDGFVPRCSQRLGKVIRDNYPLNHLDVINHTLGLLGSNNVDPVQIYRMQANRMKQDGL